MFPVWECNVEYSLSLLRFNLYTVNVREYFNGVFLSRMRLFRLCSEFKKRTINLFGYELWYTYLLIFKLYKIIFLDQR